MKETKADQKRLKEYLQKRIDYLSKEIEDDLSIEENRDLQKRAFEIERLAEEFNIELDY